MITARPLAIGLAAALALGLGLLSPARAQEAKGDAPKSKADEAKPARPDPQVLVGKPAPAIPMAEDALNGKPVALADLKGKVVLIDFWAVWCGPCVATFPHLKEWNGEFKAKGLEIVGVTSYYKVYGFDKAKGKLKRADDELAPEAERAMLRDFADHHKLEHVLMPYPRETIRYIYEDYKVSGIPEAVLIDREGIVRMVKVGSGDANAKALHEMIQTLIDEPSRPNP